MLLLLVMMTMPSGSIPRGSVACATAGASEGAASQSALARGALRSELTNRHETSDAWRFSGRKVTDTLSGAIVMPEYAYVVELDVYVP